MELIFLNTHTKKKTHTHTQPSNLLEVKCNLMDVSRLRIGKRKPKEKSYEQISVQKKYK